MPRWNRIGLLSQRLNVKIRCDPGEEKRESGQCTGINQQALVLVFSRYLIIIICTSAENGKRHIKQFILTL